MADKPNEKPEKKNRFLRDILLAVLLTALGLSAFFIVRANAEKGSSVTVYHDGESIGTYPLLLNKRYIINGGTHILVIENGSAHVEDAACPNHLCEKRGKIKNVGESIVCLPNRVEVRVEGKADVDIAMP